MAALKPSMMQAFKAAGPWAVGIAVWGSSLAMMIRGLLLGEWCGYVFAVMFLLILLAFLVLTRVMERRALKRFFEENPA